MAVLVYTHALTNKRYLLQIQGDICDRGQYTSISNRMLFLSTFRHEILQLL